MSFSSHYHCPDGFHLLFNSLGTGIIVCGEGMHGTTGLRYLYQPAAASVTSAASMKPTRVESIKLLTSAKGLEERTVTNLLMFERRAS